MKILKSNFTFKSTICSFILNIKIQKYSLEFTKKIFQFFSKHSLIVRKVFQLFLLITNANHYEYSLVRAMIKEIKEKVYDFKMFSYIISNETFFLIIR